MLRLRYDHYKAVEAHARATYPCECCGLLLGQFGANELRKATEIWPVTNAWTLAVEQEHQSLHSPDVSSWKHSQRDRFSIDPRDLLKAQKYARSQGWQIIGIYHSHPDHVAEPSERDRQSAWPQYSYLILSVRSGRVTDCKSWRLNDHSQFAPEPWQL